MVKQNATILIIGAGRMAKHFSHYLTLLNIPHLQWARKTHSAAALKALVSQASHLYLLISDAQIAPFASQLILESHQTLLHFSGHLSVQNTYSAHPLGSFSHELYTLEQYLAMSFIVDDSSPPSAQLLPGLSNATYRIPKELKSFYHALCVMSANFTCILWQKFFRELEHTFGLPASAGIPLFQHAVQNLLNNPQGALTGPLARNDQLTIQANLKALENDPFLKVYESFVQVFRQ